MAPNEKLREKLPSSPGSASRRSFVKGLGAAGVALPALAMLPRWGFAEDVAAALCQRCDRLETICGADDHARGRDPSLVERDHSAFVGLHQAHRYQRRYRLPVGDHLPGRAADPAQPWRQHTRRLHVHDLWPGHLGRMARAAERLLFRQVADRSRLV